MNKIIVTLLIYILSSCSTYSPDVKLSKDDSKTLHIVGDINPAAENEISNVLTSGIQKILITSGGGEVKSNIRIANLIKENSIAIEVIDYCMSSCFNYLFLAAKERNIKPNSLLGFHGTAETSVSGLMKNMGLFSDSLEDEKNFVKNMKFDEDIYKNLNARSVKIINASGLDAELFMVGAKFFEENHISLNNVWFPNNQNELNKTVARLAHKFVEIKEEFKTLTMVGDFDR